jgi:cell wall-associated NlpC family hydrolase
LMTSVSEPGAFLNKAGSLDHVARSNAERLRDLRAAKRELAATHADAGREFAAERATQQKLTKTKDAILASVARQEKLVAKLVTADERAAAARAAAAQRAAALRLFARKRAAADAATERAQRARASRDANRAEPPADRDNSSGDNGGDNAVANVPVTGRGAAAVRFAYDQIGKPYSWGQDGMGSFDCSGLTSRAWGSAGVSLSHSSRAQFGEGRRVSRSEIEPGDLVFFGSPIHHVGIYVGGGQMINAPQTGDQVGVRAAFRGDYVGAVRPG